VQQELAAAGSSGGISSSTSSGGGLPTASTGDGIKGYNTAPQDLQAIVDELRADIAASRAVLQQLRDTETVVQGGR